MGVIMRPSVGPLILEPVGWFSKLFLPAHAMVVNLVHQTPAEIEGHVNSARSQRLGKRRVVAQEQLDVGNSRSFEGEVPTGRFLPAVVPIEKDDRPDPPHATSADVSRSA
jgi:hypothetical protein